MSCTPAAGGVCYCAPSCSHLINAHAQAVLHPPASVISHTSRMAIITASTLPEATVHAPKGRAPILHQLRQPRSLVQLAACKLQAPAPQHAHMPTLHCQWTTLNAHAHISSSIHIDATARKGSFSPPHTHTLNTLVLNGLSIPHPRMHIDVHARAPGLLLWLH